MNLDNPIIFMVVFGGLIPFTTFWVSIPLVMFRRTRAYGEAIWLACGAVMLVTAVIIVTVLLFSAIWLSLSV